MPLIDVSIARGRSPEQLRALIAALHEAAVRSIDAVPDNVTVVVREVETELWARNGITIAERAAAPAPHDEEGRAR